MNAEVHIQQFTSYATVLKFSEQFVKYDAIERSTEFCTDTTSTLQSNHGWFSTG